MEDSQPANEPKTKNNLDARNAWVFPIISWAMSITTGLFGKSLGAFLNLAFAIIELGLFIASIVIVIKVLSNKQKSYSGNDKEHATAGIVLIGFTFVIIVIAIIAR
jgi:hypothetical protein